MKEGIEIEIAKTLLLKQMRLEFVAEVTGLSIRKIRSIQKQLAAQKNGEIR